MTIPDNATSDSLSGDEALKAAFEASIRKSLNASLDGQLPTGTTVRVDLITLGSESGMLSFLSLTQRTRRTSGRDDDRHMAGFSGRDGTLNTAGDA